MRMDDECRRLLSECIQGADEVRDRWRDLSKRKSLTSALHSEIVMGRVLAFQAAEALEDFQGQHT